MPGQFSIADLAAPPVGPPAGTGKFSMADVAPPPDRGPTLGDQVSGFFGDVLKRLNPMPAIRQWAGTPDEVTNALDAFHELSNIHRAAAADPRNKGKPVNQWVTPEPTDDQKATIERGMAANLAHPDSGATLMSPALQAGGELQRGDPRGAAASMTAGYVVPALAGAALSHVGDAIQGAKDTLQAAAKRAPSLDAAADITGLVSPRTAHGLRLLDKLRTALTPEEPAAPAAPEIPPVYDEIAKGLGGKTYANLDEAGQRTVENIAQQMNGGQPAAAPAPVRKGPPPVSDAEFAARTAAAKAAREAAPPPAPTVIPPPETAPAPAPIAPQEAAPVPPAPVAPVLVPEPVPPQAAAPAAEPAPQITKIPAAEHPGTVDFAAKARADRAAHVGPIADTLEAGGITPELAKKLAPKDWLRLSKADGIGVSIPPKLAAAVIDELDSRAAASDLAKTQQGTQGAADAAARAEALRRDTMIVPSAAYAQALQRPGAMAAAKALADEMNGVESPWKKAFAAKRDNGIAVSKAPEKAAAQTPKTVYRGTMEGAQPRHNISSEQAANRAEWYAENPIVAQRFANGGRTPPGVLYPGAKVIEATIAPQNPLIVDMNSPEWAPRGADREWSMPDPKTGQMMHEIGQIKEKALRLAERNGHDWVVFKNGYDQQISGGDIYARVGAQSRKR